MVCTCYKGHRDDLENITTSIAACLVHGPAVIAPREMHIINIPGGRD